MKTIFLTALAGLLLAAGCATAPKPTASTGAPQPAPQAVGVAKRVLDTALLAPPTEPFTLGPGDVIDVEIIADRSSRAYLRVGPDGKIYFNLLPGVDVSGLTLGQTKTRLEKELTQFVTNPQVAVALRNVGSKHVWLLGRLAKPGIYAMNGPVTLLEAIAQAGGAAQSASLGDTTMENKETKEQLADLRHSFVVRDGQLLPVDFRRLLRDGDMSQNIYLRPDDFVHLPSAQVQDVHVLGAVKFSRAVPYRDNLTLVSAISAAGGVVQYSYPSHVAIVRGSLAQPEVLVVDYNAIIQGKANDVPLEPRDIVHVPDSPYKLLSKYVDMILYTFVGTVAANEGVRAIDPDAGTVGISTPVGK